MPRGFPKLASFASRHRLDISLAAGGCIDEYLHHQTFKDSSAALPRRVP
jgi:hypothetical protein